MGLLSARGQEVDQHDFAVDGEETGFQDQRVGPVAARDPNITGNWRDAPPSVAGLPRAAKHAPESKRDQHSQSIDPSSNTSAADSQSPISP
jgi:hypothetical protein